jgi:hypothetical protein
MPAHFDKTGKRVRKGKKDAPPQDPTQREIPTAQAAAPTGANGESAPAPDARVPAPETNGQKPKPIQLTSLRDLALVRKAIEDRAGTLNSLAKKTDEEGYPQEAQREKSDAGTLLTIILPLVTGAQGQLPLGAGQELPSAVGNAMEEAMAQVGIAAKVRRDVIDALAPRIMAFGTEIANLGFAAGYAARDNDAEAIALSAVHRLRGKKAGAPA